MYAAAVIVTVVAALLFIYLYIARPWALHWGATAPRPHRRFAGRRAFALRLRRGHARREYRCARGGCVALAGADRAGRGGFYGSRFSKMWSASRWVTPPAWCGWQREPSAIRCPSVRPSASGPRPDGRGAGGADALPGSGHAGRLGVDPLGRGRLGHHLGLRFPAPGRQYDAADRAPALAAMSGLGDASSTYLFGARAFRDRAEDAADHQRIRGNEPAGELSAA